MKNVTIGGSDMSLLEAEQADSLSTNLTGSWEVSSRTVEFFNKRSLISVRKESFDTNEYIYKFQPNFLSQVISYNQSTQKWTEKVYNYSINVDNTINLTADDDDDEGSEIVFRFTLEDNDLKLARRLDDRMGCIKTSYLLKRSSN
ncbi:hypothetical protein J5U18_08950 [Sphingobacteriaceae bacterium WQ 2009]|uniref:Lipocalin-like domain-containing protein n=1 Tax=Rhinopithecimicrobium faecis TaxID=2820698 RepID=A0A8T4HEB8_9SPHI|nr:hypothetical protein [Sphingobacteriaceae bacterium WQ 2009]